MARRNWIWTTKNENSLKNNGERFFTLKWQLNIRSDQTVIETPKLLS